ncbi:MAG: hypothetical protein KME13_12655 [Myxacorys californica WJT36-NPBG1]|nr:hypothetical protein [Myxacorys californica WJT36-NPBG1]
MSIRRRAFLQAGAGTLLASLAHGCVQQSQSSPTIAISDTLLNQIKRRGHLLVATEDDYP